MIEEMQQYAQECLDADFPNDGASVEIAQNPYDGRYYVQVRFPDGRERGAYYFRAPDGAASLDGRAKMNLREMLKYIVCEGAKS